MTKNELIANRQAAGIAYAEAARALMSAWVVLQAHDIAATNANVQAADPAMASGLAPLHVPGHPEFLRGEAHQALHADPAGQALAASNELIASLA